MLLETATYFARRAAPEPPGREELADLLAEAMHELNRHGIVGVVDPSIDEEIIEVYKLLRAQGRITVRTDLLFKARDLAETETGIAATSDGRVAVVDTFNRRVQVFRLIGAAG